MKAIILIAPGFEELEAIAVHDILRRANVETKLVHVLEDSIVESAQGTKIVCDQSLETLSTEDVEIVVTPGGVTGAEHLKNSQKVLELLRDFHKQDKWIASICASPIALDAAGILRGKKYTCYPGFQDQIKDGEYTAKNVQVDGKLITASGPSKALTFAYEIVTKAISKEAVAQVKGDMLYGHCINR